MDILIKIAQLFLAFTLLVGIHEFGHFIMARIFGIRVEKFYIFFDPWFSLFKYGIGWLPLGGYVKIAGMIDESMDKEQMKRPVSPDEFRAKPAWQRFLVMIAGVVMNVLLAVAIYCGVSWAWGESYFSNDDARWGYDFSEAGHELGFRDGDRFLTIDGERVDNINEIINALVVTEGDRTVTVARDGGTATLPLERLIAMRQRQEYKDLFVLRMPFLIDSITAPGAAALRPGDEVTAIDDCRGAGFAQYAEYLAAHAGDTVTVAVMRDGEQLTGIRIPVSDEGRIGVVRRNPYELRTRDYTFAEAIPAGFRRAGTMLSSYWEQLKLIVQPKTKMYEEVGGFIAIGSIFPSHWDWQDFWLKCAFLSIILAVMNILPIPGLDGGHAIFTFWEMVTGRKVSDRILEGAQYVGLAIILLLLVYANGNDLYRFFIR